MKEYESISCVAFDVGGTLLHPWPSVGEIYGRVFSKYGLHATPAAINDSFFTVWREAHLIPRRDHRGSEKPWWCEIVRRVLSILGGSPHEEAIFEELWETFCHPENWRLYDGAEEVLCRLKEAGYKLAIVSNWDERLRPLLEKLDLIKYFDSVIISCEVGVEKPHAGIFHALIEAIGVEPHTVLHIGDSEVHDLAGAEKAGCRCLLVDPGAEKSDKLTDLCLIPEMLPARPGGG